MSDKTYYPLLQFKPKQFSRALRGCPWIFSNEIEMTPEVKKLPPGSLVAVMTSDARKIGLAYFNPHTLIAARVLSELPSIKVDADFFKARLQKALSLRERFFKDPYYRLIHAEGDELPGLIIDRFRDVFVIQANTAGMDKMLPMVEAALKDLFKPKTIIYRNDTSARELENLPLEVRFEGEELTAPLKVIENGATYFVDGIGGQKTGWFFDHRPNRAWVSRLSEGKDVLDLYSYVGSFGVLAAKSGASSVTMVDRSKPALDYAAMAASVNGAAEKCKYITADVFEEAQKIFGEGQRFDIVVADPPAFVKNKKSLESGLQGYRKLARLSSLLLKPGGVMLMASCSHHVGVDEFKAQIARGIFDAKKKGRFISVGTAGPDHPQHPHLPETSYLKSVMVEID